MALFRLFILKSATQQKLSTLRYKIFAIGAFFRKINGSYVLNIALGKKRRKWFTGLWNTSENISFPFVFLMRNLGLINISCFIII
jgi:hypothetical protein